MTLQEAKGKAVEDLNVTWDEFYIQSTHTQIIYRLQKALFILCEEKDREIERLKSEIAGLDVDNTISKPKF